MNTVTTINLGGRAYQLEEQAYTRLSQYLADAASTLEENPDKDEILADFETAIAEKCDRRLSAVKNVVTLQEVEEIIKEMGPVEEPESETTAEKKKGSTRTSTKRDTKRLYRDPDDRVIAGVASGLGHYFGVDPTLIRIILLASLLIGGTGLIAYIILWIAVPEAQTTAQKLEMRGSPVSLSSVSEILKEKVSKVHIDKKATSKLVSIPAKLFRGIGTIIQKGIFPFVRILTGVLVAIIGFVGAVALTTAVATVLFGKGALIAEIPVAIATVGSSLYVALIGGYLIALIPLILLFFGGMAIIQKKSRLRSAAVLSLLGIWFISIVVGGVAGARTVLETNRHISSDPAYQEISQPIDVAPFSKLSAHNGVRISYVASEEYGVTAVGRSKDIDAFAFTTDEHGLLTIERTYAFDHACLFFCFTRPIQVTIHAPELTAVSLKNASSFSGELVSKDPIVLSLQNASRAEIYAETPSLDASLQNSSFVKASGKVSKLNLVLQNASRYDGTDLETNTTSVHSQNASHLELGPTTSLSVTAKNASTVRYTGDPVIEEDLSNGSVLRKI